MEVLFRKHSRKKDEVSIYKPVVDGGVRKLFYKA
jgi:hypothetical protein